MISACNIIDLQVKLLVNNLPSHVKRSKKYKNLKSYRICYLVTHDFSINFMNALRLFIYLIILCVDTIVNYIVHTYMYTYIICTERRTSKIIVFVKK